MGWTCGEGALVSCGATFTSGAGFGVGTFSSGGLNVWTGFDASWFDG